ncbi:MAG: hypothetical protein QOJ99_49 [Bryobacterales bacterium]|nr:hypothetical protein [Bryobacterales bacterium]
MNRSTVKYLVLLVLVVVLFYWKTLLTNQFTLIIGSEGVNLTYAWMHFWVHSIWQRHVPLWDPYAFAGRPFAGEMLPSAFYPLHLLFALVPLNRNGVISPRFYHEYLAFTHLLCAYFTFALLRELHRSRFAAFAGACVFSLSGLLVRMMWPPYIESCIWLPAVFFFLLRALRAERRDRAVVEASLGGLCLGMSILTGGMAFFMMQAIVAVTAVVYYGASLPSAPSPDRHSHWVRMACILAVTLAVAGGIGAVQLLPAHEYGQISVRFIDGGTFPASEKIPYHRLVPGMWPQSIVSALFPAGFDGKYGGEEYYPFYIGVFPLFLAITAIWKCWENLWVRYLTGLAVLTFAYSLGEFSPLHGVLYALVPFLWLTRAANRFFYLISFALAILAAFGLDALLDPASRGISWAPAKPILKWVAIISAAALFLPGIFTQLNLGIWTALSLLLILGSCGWFVHLTANPAAPVLRVMLAAFILFDLAAFNWLEASKAALSKTGDQLEQMVSLRGAAEFVKARPGLHRVRVAVQPEPNIGDVYGIQSIWGGGATVLTAYSQLGLREDLLNVRYYIKPASVPDPGLVYQDASWKVYENPNAYPRGWIVHQAVVEPSHAGVFRRLDQPGTNLHQLAVLEMPLPRSLEPVAGTDESVRFRSYEADRMAMDVNAGSTGLLILSEMYYPGWVATVNGKTAKIYQVDGALRGIAVSRGANRIELEYAPSSFRAGAALNLLTLGCVLAGWIYSRHRAAVGGQRTMRASTSTN